MTEEPRTHATSVTDTGRVRDHNEDAVTVFVPADEMQLRERGILAVVADGMGGFDAGEVASAAAMDAFSKSYYSSQESDPVRALLIAIKEANSAVRAIPSERCGTTLVAAAVLGTRLLVLNVGDSRAYLVTPDSARQISQDHSWVAEQVRAGHLTEAQANNHARKNVLTRALGSSEYPDADVFEDVLGDACAVVLCSDGLHGLVTIEEVADAVRRSTPDRAAMKLVALANDRGGHDNISVAIVRSGSLDGLETGFSTIRRGPARTKKKLRLALIGALVIAAVIGAYLYMGGRDPGSTNGGDPPETPTSTILPPGSTVKELSPSTVTTYAMDPASTIAVYLNDGNLLLVDDRNVLTVSIRTLRAAKPISWSATGVADIAVDAEGSAWVVAQSVRLNDTNIGSGVMRLDIKKGRLVGVGRPVSGSDGATSVGRLTDEMAFCTPGGSNWVRSFNPQEDSAAVPSHGSDPVIDLGTTADNQIALSNATPDSQTIGTLGNDGLDKEPWYAGNTTAGSSHLAVADRWYAPFHRGKQNLFFFPAAPRSTAIPYVVQKDLGVDGVVADALVWVAPLDEFRAAIVYRHPSGGVAIAQINNVLGD